MVVQLPQRLIAQNPFRSRRFLAVKYILVTVGIISILFNIVSFALIDNEVNTMVLPKEMEGRREAIKNTSYAIMAVSLIFHIFMTVGILKENIYIVWTSAILSLLAVISLIANAALVGFYLIILNVVVCALLFVYAIMIRKSQNVNQGDLDCAHSNYCI